MKFSDMPYTRPDFDALKAELEELCAQLKAAGSYEQAKAAFLKKEELLRHVETLGTLVHVRHSIDTRDEFYNAEEELWNAVEPELEEYIQSWTMALLESPFRAEFAAEYGELMFTNAEIALKTFSPEIIPQLQKENELAQQYEKLLASAQIPFEGGVYTLSQLTPFKSCADDAQRLAAWKAEGQWYKDNQAEFDRLYDERMGRNCYTKEDVERFRAAVRDYVVPVAAEIYKKQAERLDAAYPMSFADAALEFRSGNPRPQGSPDEILREGVAFYEALSPEAGEFFKGMVDMQLLDVLSTEGKQSGGYCTSLPDYGMPFIFANFNGTQGDIEVITHEAGHGFAAWLNRDRIPMSNVWPSMEACEVHSMSMEFFGESWADKFFGADARKFLYSHLAGALTFIPYGTMVDHFQHEVYARPEMSPKERHAVWKVLLGVYMPWLKLDGEIPFYADGEGWQRQHHIYSSPFYYIDYCLAQTVSLEFWAMLQEDKDEAWRRYMAYAVQGGSETFTKLLSNAGLESPFDESCLKKVCAKAAEALDRFDMSGIK